MTHAKAPSVMSDSRAITLLTLGTHPVDSDQALGQPPRENPTKSRPARGPPPLSTVWEPRWHCPSDALPGACPSPQGGTQQPGVRRPDRSAPTRQGC